MEKETRVAVISTVIENEEAAEAINGLLHAYADFIIGRMGVPYRKKGINVITVVLDAPPDAISALSGKLGRIRGVTSKVLYAKSTKADPQ
ncbi:MAG: iron-only hydrogenase system regulator [Ruminiclostridium sp.]|nr:iron-only hydrogenase system regulator [Ruminiclostridium sp.]